MYELALVGDRVVITRAGRKVFAFDYLDLPYAQKVLDNLNGGAR